MKLAETWPAGLPSPRSTGSSPSYSAWQNSVLMHLGQQQRMAQAKGPKPKWETCCGHLRKQISGWESSVFPFLCSSSTIAVGGHGDKKAFHKFLPNLVDVLVFWANMVHAYTDPFPSQHCLWTTHGSALYTEPCSIMGKAPRCENHFDYVTLVKYNDAMC